MVALEFASAMTGADSTHGIRFADDPIRRALVAADAREIMAHYADGTVLIEGAGQKAVDSVQAAKLRVSGRLPEGEVILGLTAHPRAEYLIEVSEDLATWFPLRTISMANSGSEFLDSGAKRSSNRFYRIIPQR